LGDAGLTFDVVGSVARGGPARDLDIVVDVSATKVAKLAAALEPLVDMVEAELRMRLSRATPATPLRLDTAFGPLDVWGAQR
jgi:predicted nucleotidyltransferase